PHRIFRSRFKHRRKPLAFKDQRTTVTGGIGGGGMPDAQLPADAADAVSGVKAGLWTVGPVMVEADIQAHKGNASPADQGPADAKGHGVVDVTVDDPFLVPVGVELPTPSPGEPQISLKNVVIGTVLRSPGDVAG